MCCSSLFLFLSYKTLKTLTLNCPFINLQVRNFKQIDCQQMRWAAHCLCTTEPVSVTHKRTLATLWAVDGRQCVLTGVLRFHRSCSGLFQALCAASVRPVDAAALVEAEQQVRNTEERCATHFMLLNHITRCGWCLNISGLLI